MSYFKTTRVIREVVPKAGSSRNPCHDAIIGRPCVVLDFSIGKPAWIAVDTHDEPWVLHRIKTSPVKDFHTEKDADGLNVLVLETRNTEYRIAEATEEERTTCYARFDIGNFKTMV